MTVGSVSIVSDVLIGCVSVALDVLVTCVSVALEVVVTGVSVSCGLVEEEGGTEEESPVLLPQEIKRIKSKARIRNIPNFFITEAFLYQYMQVNR